MLRSLYFSLIHPYILYCLPLYAATSETHITPLKLLQKRAIRIISGAGYLEHTEPLFFENKILKIQDQYKHSLACYVYKHPEILSNHQRNHNYQTRFRDQFLPPFERLCITQQSVIFNAIKLWNEIPQNIRERQSINGFKYHYKNFLLDQYDLPDQ